MGKILFSFLFADGDPAAPLILPDSVQKAQWADTIRKIATVDWNDLMRSFLSEAVWVVVKILVALAIYFVGRCIIRWFQRVMERGFERRKVDASLRTFLRNLVNVIFYLLLLLAVVQTLGVNVTSIIAIFSAATLAVGMALSGTMQNFAGGVMILLLRPYRVGDYISAQGQSGTVEEIMLFSTKILTGDRQTIYIPNSAISTSIIDNYSHSALRRVDIAVAISYGDDVDAARAAILELCRADGRVLADPAPVVYVAELADNSVNLSLRAWVNNADYWAVFFSLNEQIYKTLPQRGLHFPFPQLDVHITKD